jgi:transcriptional regulator with XRE-family HTH domain
MDIDGQAVKVILGKNVKFLRFRKNYSQAVLAEKADTSANFISNIERGLKFPHPDVLARLANALEVEIGELFKTEKMPEYSKELMDQLSEDMTTKVISTVHEVFGKYMDMAT